MCKCYTESARLSKLVRRCLQRLEDEVHASDVTGAETFQDAVGELERRERTASVSAQEVSPPKADAGHAGGQASV
jgi:hypothetical protein